MQTFSKSVQVAAPPDRVWQVMIDVERWSEWTRSVTSIKRLEAGPFTIGSRARVLQPKLFPAVWTVTEINLGRSFTWVSHMPGLAIIGYHAVEAVEQGSRVTLSIRFEGLFSGIAARVFRKLNEEYLSMEAQGLKNRCETSRSS